MNTCELIGCNFWFKEQCNLFTGSDKCCDPRKAVADELVGALETAIGMLKHVGCPNNNCRGGAIQVSEDDFEQCQWCYEASYIAEALGKLQPKEGDRQ